VDDFKSEKPDLMSLRWECCWEFGLCAGSILYCCCCCFYFAVGCFHFGVQQFLGGSFGVSLYLLWLILILLMIAMLNKFDNKN
jgi:hypothetical protein